MNARTDICCVQNDQGKWVSWELYYKPVDTGEGALTQLKKDGKIIFKASNKPNAYLNDNDAYIKLGLYKAHWKEPLSSSKEIRMLFGPILVKELD